MVCANKIDLRDNKTGANERRNHVSTEDGSATAAVRFRLYKLFPCCNYKLLN